MSKASNLPVNDVCRCHRWRRTTTPTYVPTSSTALVEEKRYHHGRRQHSSELALMRRSGSMSSVLPLVLLLFVETNMTIVSTTAQGFLPSSPNHDDYYTQQLLQQQALASSLLLWPPPPPNLASAAVAASLYAPPIDDGFHHSFSSSIPQPQLMPSPLMRAPEAPPSTSVFTLPRAEYRRSPTAQRRYANMNDPDAISDSGGVNDGVDATQREQLARLALEVEPFPLLPPSLGRMVPPPLRKDASLESFLSRLASKTLPRIAESVMQSTAGTNRGANAFNGMGNSAATMETDWGLRPGGLLLRPPTSSAWSPSSENAADRIGGSIDEEATNPRNEISGSTPTKSGDAAVIDTMPNPSALLTFNRLVSSFVGNGMSDGKGGGSNNAAGEPSSSIDASAGLDRERRDELQQREERRLGKTAAASSNTTSTFNSGAVISATTPLPTHRLSLPETDADNKNGGNFLASLMQGVSGGSTQFTDWLGGFFGQPPTTLLSSSTLGKSSSTATINGGSSSVVNDGNALAQFLGRNKSTPSILHGGTDGGLGLLFGSALN